MKRIIFSVVVWLTSLISIYSQGMPTFVQQRLDSMHQIVENNLRDFRYGEAVNFPYLLSSQYANIFSYDETLLIDSLVVNLNIGMIYDDEMRNRIVELMQNKYREYELDTIVNRYIQNSIRGDRNKAFEKCRFDTLSIFQETLDSFYIDLQNRETKNLGYKYMYNFKVFELMQLDTTRIFKQEYDKVVEEEKEEMRVYFQSEEYNRHNNYTNLAKVCGYIGDKRFIQPLIEELEKPDNFNREEVFEALARMRVEPYYSDYVKFRMPRTMERIKTKRVGFKIDDFVEIIGTQEAFLELSKYLLSDIPYSFESGLVMSAFPVSEDAFCLIRDNVENEDLQKIIDGRNAYYNPELLQPVYDWMQKNYGKYKIKRIW